MKRATYICLEGTEGVGKTTQTEKLVTYLEAKGFRVLKTKEPGTFHVPLTVQLRTLMLNVHYEKNFIELKHHVSKIINEYDMSAVAKRYLKRILEQEGETMPAIAREYLAQVIRAIHLDQLIYPARDQYDFIIQDRGLLSSLAYGMACGHELSQLELMAAASTGDHKFYNLYDRVIILLNDPKTALDRAQSAKQEFKEGDAMEQRGVSFMCAVQTNMIALSKNFPSTLIGMADIDQVFHIMLKELHLA